MRFATRSDAGRQLADRLAGLDLEAPVVLALPRGGVPVALEVARRLAAPLDLIMVRKIGAPWQSELALAAGTLRTAEREHLLEESLTRLEQEFRDRFVRIHRNCLVARDSIDRFERAGEDGAEGGSDDIVNWEDE